MRNSLIGQQGSIGLQGLDTGYPSLITDAVAPRSYQKDLFLNQAEGYVNALEKSTSPVKRLREVFEHSRESCCASIISNP